jgi:hypothetical protein
LEAKMKVKNVKRKSKKAMTPAARALQRAALSPQNCPHAQHSYLHLARWQGRR